MALLSVNNLHKGFAQHSVLEGVTFSVGEGEHVALVGPNGCGKSTLLRIIVDAEYADRGSASLLPGISIGYLAQEAGGDLDICLRTYVVDARPRIPYLHQEMREIESAMSGTTEDGPLEALIERHGEALAEFESLGGFEYEAQAHAIMAGLGFGPEDLEKPLAVMSGGQRTRACLARLLLQAPTLLCLDEPTNHLDVEALEWLEEFLRTWPGTVLLVSHDRYFLDRVADRIIDLEGGVAAAYRGNYSAYVRQKELALKQQEEAYQRQQEEILRLEAYIRRYKEGNRATMAKSRENRLSRLNRLQRPDSQHRLHFAIKPAESTGRSVLSLNRAAKAYGSEVLFRGLSLEVERGDRLGIIGPNGAGKSTLIRILIGEEELDDGLLTLGHNVQVGYFSQHAETLDGTGTVLDEILNAGDILAGEARNLLARFLFRGDEVFKSIASLSGGERNRLTIAKLLVEAPNVLILDEPTNHLDIACRSALEDALRSYGGTVIFASHDRYLLRAAATRLLMLSGGTARVLDRTYEEARAMLAAPSAPPRTAAPAKTDLTANGKRRKSIPPARLLAQVEREIADTEARLAGITTRLADAATYADGADSAHLQRDYEALTARLEELLPQWEAAAAAAEAA